MRKIREVLRLDSLGLKQRQIARSCSIGQSTVSEYLKAAEAAQLNWSEVADCPRSLVSLFSFLGPITFGFKPASPLILGRSWQQNLQYTTLGMFIRLFLYSLSFLSLDHGNG